VPIYREGTAPIGCFGGLPRHLGGRGKKRERLKRTEAGFLTYEHGGKKGGGLLTRFALQRTFPTFWKEEE